MLRRIQKTFLFACSVLVANSACQKMSFERIFHSCEAPNNSARFGVQAGPLITEPQADSLVAGVVTVRGTCVDQVPVSIQDTSGQLLETNCQNNSFEAQVTLRGEDGLKSLSVSQNTAQDGSAMLDRLCFMKDGTPPVVGITNGNSSQSMNEPITTVSGICEDGLTVVISGPGLMNPVETSCNNGTFTSPVQTVPGDGIKNIQATQIDPLGNQGNDTAKYTIDTLAPQIQITSPVAGQNSQNTILIAGTCEAGLAVGIGSPNSSNSLLTNCPDGRFSISVPLTGSDGVKEIQAFQVDPAGNRGQDSRNFVKDTTAPNVTIALPLASANLNSNITFSGTCEAGLPVHLSGSVLNSAQNITCPTGSWTLTATITAGQGTKTLIASQIDSTGNQGQDQRSFQVDTIAPVLSFTSPTSGSYVNSTATIQGTCETGLSVQISGSGISTPVSAVCSNGIFSGSVTISAQDGQKQVTISQTDLVGNTGSASRSFVRDSLAPVLTITSPSNGATLRNTLNLTGTCEAGLTVSFSGTGIAPNSTVLCASNNTFTRSLNFSAGDGPKVINLSETDAAGNTAQVVGNFIKDTTAPVITITSPAPNTSAQTGLNIAGTCEVNLNVTISGASLNAPVITTCSAAGTFFSSIVFSNGDGPKAVTVSQTDSSGNTASDSRTFVRDNMAPALTINSPAANSYIAQSFTLQGACQTGLPVHISGSGIQATANVACLSGAYSADLMVSMGDGVKNILAAQTDAAGNSSQVSRNYLYDTQPPRVTIDSPRANASVAPTTIISGACESGLPVTLTGDLTNNATSVCSNGNYHISVTFTEALGAKNVIASQTDGSGNSGQASTRLVRESNSAVETFLADASFGKIDILFVDDNSASMDPQQASLGSKFSGFAAELQQIDWQIGITTTDCSAGPYGICGSLLQMNGTSTDILTKSVPNYSNVFNNTIQRPETAGCLNTGTCPAGNSQPLLSATTAMTKHNTDNNGFFRANSDLAIVILSDADEGQNSPALFSNRPAELVSTFNSLWTNGKKLSVYSIIVKPGDTTCLNQLTALNGGFSFFGKYIDQTVGLTSGISTSICAPDYSVTLKSIGESVRTLTNSVELANTPIAGSVTVTFNPSQAITHKVIGKKVVFDSPPSVGTEIQVSYQH